MITIDDISSLIRGRSKEEKKDITMPISLPDSQEISQKKTDVYGIVQDLAASLRNRETNDSRKREYSTRGEREHSLEEPNTIFLQSPKKREISREREDFYRPLIDLSSRNNSGKIYSESLDDLVMRESRKFRESDDKYFRPDIRMIDSYISNNFSKEYKEKNIIINKYNNSLNEHLSLIDYSFKKNSNISNLEKILIESNLVTKINDFELMNNGGLRSYISDLVSEGYNIIRKDKFVPQEIIPIPIKQPEETAQPEVSFRTSVPGQYTALVQKLAAEFPGLRYLGKTSLQDKSQHNVDILTFDYMEHGQRKQMHLVAKDNNTLELALPEFLNEIGVHTPLVQSVGGRLVFQYVGQYELRDVVRQSSQGDVIKACNMAMDKIAQIHVLATMHLPQLQRDYGITLPATNYMREFQSRFLVPVMGSSLIISPQANRLMQAYSHFARHFYGSDFVHGDFHTSNCRMDKDEVFVIDYEWAKVGMNLDDVSRFVNSVLRDRQDFDPHEFTRETFNRYMQLRNQHAEAQGAPIIMSNAYMASLMDYAMINDELYKAGEYVTFAEKHPTVGEEKILKSADCIDNVMQRIDSLLVSPNGGRQEFKVLSNLRDSLVDFMASSPYEHMRQMADKYRGKLVTANIPLLRAA
jgi:tRNA A-37 threonylcarbamoyl transferase component Bud32